MFRGPPLKTPSVVTQCCVYVLTAYLEILMFSGFFKWQHNHSSLTPTSAVLWVSPDKFLAPREVKTLRGCLDTNKSSQNSAEEQSWNLLCHALNQSMAHWSKLCSIDSRWVSGPLLLPFVQKGTILTATRRLYSCCKILLFLYFKSSVVTKLLFASPHVQFRQIFILLHQTPVTNNQLASSAW